MWVLVIKDKLQFGHLQINKKSFDSEYQYRVQSSLSQNTESLYIVHSSPSSQCVV